MRGAVRVKEHLLVTMVTCALGHGCTPTVAPTERDERGGGFRLVDGGGLGGDPGGGAADGSAGIGDGLGVDAGPGGGMIADPAMFETDVPLDTGRPVELMSREQLARVAARVPRVEDDFVRGVLESADTVWYDRRSIVPGYQDSFGDNVVTPIGMRPNTIDSNLIELAVPGGHGWIFQTHGVFHFPFGRPARSTEEHLYVANFWRVPREAGRLLPVVWWQRDPNSYTHRIEWMFPRGTVLGEMMFIVDASGELWPFEIRVRVRELDGWRSDVLRPFPGAAAFADALDRKRAERAEWAAAPDIAALVAHARDPATLAPVSLGSTEFRGAFSRIDGAEDALPAIADPTILRELLVETPFRSARGATWKTSGSLTAYAPTSRSGFSIVPRDYAGGFLRVDDATCDRCHRDAGRPFRDWYPDIIAYGELWGEDESFTWHPFETSRFVDSRGAVVNFNHDNRTMRADFVSAGVLVRYDRASHPDALYRKLPGEWKDYAY